MATAERRAAFGAASAQRVPAFGAASAQRVPSFGGGLGIVSPEVVRSLGSAPVQFQGGGLGGPPVQFQGGGMSGSYGANVYGAGVGR
jgi:hypothetical protein